MSLQDSVMQHATDAKVLIGSGATVIAAGSSQTFDWIPDDIGKMASLAGALAMLIPLYFAFKRSKREDAEAELKAKEYNIRMERELLDIKLKQKELEQ